MRSDRGEAEALLVYACLGPLVLLGRPFQAFLALAALLVKAQVRVLCPPPPGRAKEGST